MTWCFLVVGYFAQTNVPVEPNPTSVNVDGQIPFREQRVGVGVPAANLFSSVEKEVVVAQKDSANSSMEKESGSRERSGDKRHIAIQEKNRRAQKRFRERQKAKMADMSEQLDEMTKELGKLRMENNALKNRNGVLERVLALRDEHIRMLQDEQQVFDLGSTYLKEQASLPGSETQKLLTTGANPELNATGQQLMSFDANAVKSMPFPTVVSQWKEFVRRLGNYLVEIEGVTGDSQDEKYRTAFANLCQTLDMAGEMCMQIAVLHPTNMQRLIATTLDEGRSGISADDHARWASITAALQLTDEQKGQIIALWHIFERRVSKVMVVRQGILEKLQSVTIPDRLVALQSVISETLKVNEATTALKANLQEEHLCGMEFLGTVFKTIMLPMQKARMIVQSYPFYPDINRIASILLEEKEAGAPAAMMDGGNVPGGVDVAGQEHRPQNPNLLNIPSVYKG